jgi:hypothetical protein
MESGMTAFHPRFSILDLRLRHGTMTPAPVPNPDSPAPTFADLIASRREWIDAVLKPWCRQASRADLLQAEQEWVNLAGRVDPERTLWAWAWSRFPGLVSDGLHGLDESQRFEIRLNDGSQQTGYPDARRSRQGLLVLIADGELREHGPVSIDDIQSIARCPS